MTQYGERLLAFLISKSTKPGWLVLLWLIATCAIVAVFLGSGVTLAPQIVWPLAGLCAIVVAFVARAYALPPKIAKGKVGISFAIATEGDSEEKKVQFDLVSAVRRALEERPTEIPFKVQLIPSRLFPSGIDREQAELLLRQSRSRFLLFGDLRRRKSGAKEVYSLRFTGMVSHAPTSSDNSSMLGAEMSSVLPLKVDIDCNADLEGFEVTSGQIAGAAKYIVAVAYFLSNAPREAVQLLQTLHQTASSVEQTRLPQGKQLAELVERRLCDFQLHHASVLHFDWRHSHERKLIEEVEEILVSLPPRSSQRVDVRNLLAMCAFILRGDTLFAQNTFSELAKAEPRNPIWVYSLAFLSAFDGDLEKAHRLYKRAFELDDSAALSIEIEEFVAWCAEAHAERPQLFYCLGYINGRQKKDAQRAVSDFRRFIDLADPNQYTRRIDLARRFIVRLERGEWINS